MLHLFAQYGLLCGNVHSANKKKRKEEKLDRKIRGTAKLTKEVMPIGAALDFFSYLLLSWKGTSLGGLPLRNSFTQPIRRRNARHVSSSERWTSVYCSSKEILEVM